MTAVRAEATPPPIAFPWLRALPGLAVWGVAIVWAVIEIFRVPARETAGSFSTSFGELVDRFTAMVHIADIHQTAWILLALAMTVTCLKLTWRLAHRRT